MRKELPTVRPPTGSVSLLSLWAPCALFPDISVLEYEIKVDSTQVACRSNAHELYRNSRQLVSVDKLYSTPASSVGCLSEMFQQQ